MCRDRESKRTFGNTLQQTKVTLTSQQTLIRCFGDIHYTFPNVTCFSLHRSLCHRLCRPCVNVFSIHRMNLVLWVWTMKGRNVKGLPLRRLHAFAIGKVTTHTHSSGVVSEMLCLLYSDHNLCAQGRRECVQGFDAGLSLCV